MVLLENCGVGRQREVEAIKDLATNIMKEITAKYENVKQRIDCKVYDKCGSKFDFIEEKILSTVREELSFIATPLPFTHPPTGNENLRKRTFSKQKSNTSHLDFFAELRQGASSPAPTPTKIQNVNEVQTKPTLREKMPAHIEERNAKKSSDVIASKAITGISKDDGVSVPSKISNSITKTEATPTSQNIAGSNVIAETQEIFANESSVHPYNLRSQIGKESAPLSLSSGTGVISEGAILPRTEHPLLIPRSNLEKELPDEPISLSSESVAAQLKEEKPLNNSYISEAPSAKQQESKIYRQSNAGSFDDFVSPIEIQDPWV